MIFPYFKHPQGWSPHQIPPSGERLTHLDSFYVVIAPEGKTQIQNYDEYKGLLKRRVEWMIHQWMEEQITDMGGVHQMLNQLLAEDPVPQLATPNRTEATPERWAQALVDSPWLASHWTLEIQLEYPMPMEPEPAEREWIVGAVENQTLEEWMLSFTRS